jgi:hypothetical protein
MLLDFVLYVQDDSLLLTKTSKAEPVQQQLQRLEHLASSKSLSETPWHSAFKSLLDKAAK